MAHYIKAAVGLLNCATPCQPSIVAHFNCLYALWFKMTHNHLRLGHNDDPIYPLRYHRQGCQTTSLNFSSITTSKMVKLDQVDRVYNRVSRMIRDLQGAIMGPNRSVMPALYRFNVCIMTSERKRRVGTINSK